MKDVALSLVEKTPDPGLKLNLLREYVQAFVMRSLSESEAFQNLSFVGGTALRFFFELPRFSEDLDFSLESNATYEPKKWLDKLKRDLDLSGFKPTITWNDRKTIHIAWIRIGELLQEVKLAPVSNQKLSIKLEIDTRPPQGAGLMRQVINRYMLFAVQHHDLSSLMAGKIHALLTRPYTKGRDWYDLLWYRSQRPVVEPNLTLLQNALDQTHASDFDAREWPRSMQGKLGKLDENRILAEVRPFLERPRDADLMTKKNFEELLRSAAP